MSLGNLTKGQRDDLEEYLSNWDRMSLLELVDECGGLAGFLRERASDIGDDEERNREYMKLIMWAEALEHN